MAYFIFAGDMLVMAFMAAVVGWVSIRASDSTIRASARIRYLLTEPVVVELDLFDLGGRQVAALIGGRTEPAGWHEVPLEGRGIAAGAYFCRLKAGSDTQVLRVLRIE